MKAEPTDWLISLKPIENLELLLVYEILLTHELYFGAISAEKV